MKQHIVTTIMMTTIMFDSLCMVQTVCVRATSVDLPCSLVIFLILVILLRLAGNGQTEFLNESCIRFIVGALAVSKV